jgi:hypothetical protein
LLNTGTAAEDTSITHRPAHSPQQNGVGNLRIGEHTLQLDQGIGRKEGACGKPRGNQQRKLGLRADYVANVVDYFYVPPTSNHGNEQRPDSMFILDPTSQTNHSPQMRLGDGAWVASYLRHYLLEFFPRHYLLKYPFLSFARITFSAISFTVQNMLAKRGTGLSSPSAHCSYIALRQRASDGIPNPRNMLPRKPYWCPTQD